MTVVLSPGDWISYFSRQEIVGCLMGFIACLMDFLAVC